MSNSDIKRQLGGMPTGPNRFAGQTFTVTHRKAEEPLPAIDFEGFELFTTTAQRWKEKGFAPDMGGPCGPCKQPFQDLEEAVERMIRLGILR